MIYKLLKLRIYSVQKFLLMILLFGIVNQIPFAQNRAIDSLITILDSAKEDTNKVNTFLELINTTFNKSDYKISLHYADESLVLSEKLNYKKGIAWSWLWIAKNNGNLNNYEELLKITSRLLTDTSDRLITAHVYMDQGIAYFHQDKYTEALKNLSLALRIWEEMDDKVHVAFCYSKIGSIYSFQGHYDEAIKYELIALKIQQDIGDKRHSAETHYNIGCTQYLLGNYSEALSHYIAGLKLYEEVQEKLGISMSYNSLGNLYIDMGNDSLARQYYLASLKSAQEIGDKSGMAIGYGNIGLMYKDDGNYPEALINLFLAVNIYQEIGDKYGTENCFGNIGHTYSQQNNLPEALKYYFASLKIAQEIGDTLGMALSYSDIGIAYFNQHKTSDGRKWLKKCLDISKNLGKKDLIRQTYEKLAEIERQTGNYKMAYDYHINYSLYNDSLFNEKSKKLMTEMKEKYESEKKENEIALLNNEKEVQTLDLKKQKLAKNYLIASLSLMTILSIFVYRNYRTKQKLKLQTLRNKIASDLHDDVGSTLSSISIFSQMAQQQSKEVIPMLETIGDSSRKMLDAMADIVWTIKPENDQFEKIILRMRSFAFELLGAKNIDFEFQADDEVSNMKLSMEVRKNLYLIFKEATNNLVKYSSADRAFFTIKKEASNLSMLIRDNGKGFDVANVKEGNGLTNMKKRAKEIGAQFMIDSQPGNGTTIQLKLAV